MAITIKDIARMAGVSISTVSRVINNSKPVNSEVKQRVLSIIKEMNFSPNAMARGLVKNESGLIGMIVPAITNNVFGDVVDGVSKVAELYNYDILLSLTEGVLHKEIHYLNLHKEKQVDGIIFSSEILKREHTEIIEQSQIPSVLLGQVSTHEKIPSVHLDNFQASYEAVSYLIQRGHTKIAMIRGIESDKAVGQERYRGYKSALRDAGIPLQEEWVVICGFSLHDGYEAMNRILDSGSRPSAIFAATDRMAIGAMNYLLETGYSVPEDFSIIGFDDIDMTVAVRPKLTTVHYSAHEMGMTTFRSLLQLIKGESVENHHLNVLHRLVVRESVKEIST